MRGAAHPEGVGPSPGGSLIRPCRREHLGCRMGAAGWDRTSNLPVKRRSLVLPVRPLPGEVRDGDLLELPRRRMMEGRGAIESPRPGSLIPVLCRLSYRPETPTGPLRSLTDGSNVDVG